MPEGPSPTSGPAEPPARERPAARPPRAPAQRAPGAYLRLALWQRFVLSLGIAAVLIVALVIYVSHHNTDAVPVNDSASSELQANREAAILERQDQAPHVVRLRAGETPARGLATAVRAEVGRQVSRGSLEGPVTRARCTPARSSGPARLGFDCRVIAVQVSYPFLGVVDARTRRITFCKRDAPPAPSVNVPVSRRCLA
jgi:hypothetical protein